MKHKTHNKKGFTIVELLVVVAIIALLASMVIISVQHSKAKSRDAKRVTDINTLVTALAFYNNNFGSYPVEAGGYYIINREDPGAVLYDELVTSTGLLKALLTDPVNTGDYQYYYESSDGTDYYLQYYLETNTIPGRSKDDNPQYVVP